MPTKCMHVRTNFPTADIFFSSFEESFHSSFLSLLFLPPQVSCVSLFTPCEEAAETRRRRRSRWSPNHIASFRRFKCPGNREPFELNAKRDGQSIRARAVLDLRGRRKEWRVLLRVEQG